MAMIVHVKCIVTIDACFIYLVAIESIVQYYVNNCLTDYSPYVIGRNDVTCIYV